MDGHPSRLLSVCGELIMLWLIWIDENLSFDNLFMLADFRDEGFNQAPTRFRLRVYERLISDCEPDT